MTDSAHEPEQQPDDSDIDSAEDDAALDFLPVRLRYRRDGWTPDRQHAFIEALAESGCVEQACRRVGKSVSSAYALRTHSGSVSFCLAWDAAIEMAVIRLADTTLSRALHGEVVPHYYKGELVGEHRRYDNRLAMWILRCRDPVRYGKWIDKRDWERHPQGPTLVLRECLRDLLDFCFGFMGGRPPVARGKVRK